MSKALILAAHGSSKHERINRPMFELANRISAQLPEVFVTPAFIDGKPNVREIIMQIEHDEVLVIPFMASQGYYSDIVFPKALFHQEKQVQFTTAIGADNRLCGLVDRRVTELETKMNLPDVATLVVVGHGTRKNKNSCRTTIDLVQRLRTSRPNQKIEFAFIDQNPGLELIAGRLESECVLIVPFLMGMGPHTTQDIPEAFGIVGFEEQVFDTAFEFPFVQTRTLETGTKQKLIYDAPLGTYPELTGLCIELYNQTNQQAMTLERTVS